MPEAVRVAVVQDCPVPFDVAGTLAKAERLTAEAAKTGAKLVVFPEAFVAGYPKGLDFGVRVGIAHAARAARQFRRYFESAIDVPGPAHRAHRRGGQGEHGCTSSSA